LEKGETMSRRYFTVFMLGMLLLIASMAHAGAQNSPVASFAWTPKAPLVNEKVIFDASASFDSGGIIVSYSWDFGDGSTPITLPEAVTNHTYTLEGNYTVTLKVTDDGGLSDTQSKSLTIIEYPVARFGYSPAYPLVGETVTFDASASSPEGGVIVSYSWNFGDGTVVGVTDPITTHIYIAYGNYTVTLAVTDSEGLTNSCSEFVAVRKPPLASFTCSLAYPLVGETVTFDASASSPEGGVIVSYSWNFGDGAYGDGTIVTHAYSTFGNYSATLNITDSEGLSSTTAKLIMVRSYPVARFGYSPAYPLVGETVTFDASASSPEGGVIVSYSWNFGDGGTTSGAIVAHAYSGFGTYNVTLAVTDSEGLNATCTTPIRILIAPVANFTHSPSTPIVNETVTFDASSSHDADGNVAHYVWNFGDGNITTVSNPTIYHSYRNTGVYNVTLQVVDNDGLTDKTSKSIVIYTFIPTHDVAVREVKPSASFVYKGNTINITVVVANQGTGVETFNVTLYYNDAPIGTQTVTYLAPGENATLTFSWNTTDTTRGSYTISAYASSVPGETNTGDNIFINGKILVTTPGDVDGDHLVDMLDISLIIDAFLSHAGDAHYKPEYDINGDGVVDMVDISLTIDNFMTLW
jgi:PKD repeat protein